MCVCVCGLSYLDLAHEEDKGRVHAESLADADVKEVHLGQRVQRDLCSTVRREGGKRMQGTWTRTAVVLAQDLLLLIEKALPVENVKERQREEMR